MKKLMILFLIGIVLVSGCVQEETELTPEECEARGGRTLNIVGGASCDDNEINIGEVIGFISPNICCVPA